MKKLIKFFAISMMAVTLTFSFTACEDDPVKPDGQTQQGDDPGNNEEIFANTSWTATMNGDYTYQGIYMLITLDGSLDFFDGKTGEMFFNLIVDVPAYPAANQEMNETIAFTYTVDGNTITFTYEYENEETGQMETSTETMVYDPKNETISYDWDDPDMAMMMGTSVVVFTKVQ